MNSAYYDELLETECEPCEMENWLSDQADDDSLEEQSMSEPDQEEQGLFDMDVREIEELLDEAQIREFDQNETIFIKLLERGETVHLTSEFDETRMITITCRLEECTYYEGDIVHRINVELEDLMAAPYATRKLVNFFRVLNKKLSGRTYVTFSVKERNGLDFYNWITMFINQYKYVDLEVNMESRGPYIVFYNK